MGMNSVFTRYVGLRCSFINHRFCGENAHKHFENTNQFSNRNSNLNKHIKSVRLAYSIDDKEEQNFGSPVVIMHGLMGCKRNWNSISKAINSKIKRKVFTVDARNHGDSPHSSEMTYHHMVEDLRTFIEEHHLDRVSAIGHSMGGRAMMLLALTYPELVENLIVVDMSPTVSSPSLNVVKSFLEAMQQIKFEEHMSLTAARKLMDEKLVSIVTSPTVRQFLAMNLTQTENGNVKWRVNLDTLIHSFDEISSFPTTGKTFKGPTYFIGGGNSDYLRREDEQKIKRIFPSAVFEYVPGSGHWVHSEKPNEFLELVCTFLTNH